MMCGPKKAFKMNFWFVFVEKRKTDGKHVNFWRNILTWMGRGMNMFLILFPFVVQLLLPKKSETLTCYKCSHNDFKKSSPRSIYDRIEISLKSCRKVEFCNGTWCVQHVDGNKVSLGCVNQSAASFGEDILLSLDANNQLVDSDSPSVDSHCRAYLASNDGLMHGVCYCRTRDLCNHSSRRKISPTFLILLPLLFILSQ